MKDAVRAAELYRRAPFLVGDEAAVLRYARGFRRRRRLVQLGFVAGIVGLAVALSLFRIPDIAVGAGAFAALSTAFVLLHLGVGKRAWMRPMEAYEDGLAGSEITALFCRRRFVPWKDVEEVTIATGEGAGKTLRARFGGTRALESAPGEFNADAADEFTARVAKAREEAKAAKLLLESMGGP